MPTTFNVIYLGVLADIDTSEGDNVAENAASLVGLTIGSYGDALSGRIQSFSPVGGGRRFDSDFNSYYDQNDSTPERFRIDGGDTQDFDATAIYDATITYLDGTTAEITAVLFQDTEGRTYLAPEVADNADQAALEAGPILSLTLNGLTDGTNAYLGLSGDRQSWAEAAPCFVAGTEIATAKGARRVEDLKIGDRIITQDSGMQKIRWIGHTECAARDNLAPIRIARGALGNGLPVRDLLVSPQHRMLLRSRIAERMTGESEVLLAAKKLLGVPGISVVEDMDTVSYHHILFDRHEIIFAEGAPTESLLAGAQALTALDPDLAQEILTLFPELSDHSPTPARAIPLGRVQRQLVARHMKNEKALLAV